MKIQEKQIWVTWLINEVYTISNKEMETVIKELPKGKACDSDNIAAELLQSRGEKGIEIRSVLINKIFKSGHILEDFRKSIFVTVPKVNRAQECSDFRKIILISHASKAVKLTRPGLSKPRARSTLA